MGSELHLPKRVARIVNQRGLFRLQRLEQCNIVHVHGREFPEGVDAHDAVVGEAVDVAFAPPPTEEEAAAKTVTVRCVLTESGAARVTVDDATRECVAL